MTNEEFIKEAKEAEAKRRTPKFLPKFNVGDEVDVKTCKNISDLDKWVSAIIIKRYWSVDPLKYGWCYFVRYEDNRESLISIPESIIKFRDEILEAEVIE